MKERNSKPDTVGETIRWFKEGKGVEEIAKGRMLAVSTIEGHFARAIRNGTVAIEEVMPVEEAKKIATYFPAQPELASLNSIKEKAPGEITYGKLRMVSEWLMKQREK